MGCGKSSAGKLLAKQAGLAFLDCDVYIEKTAGMTIPEIFSRFGEEYFRELEARCAAELIMPGGAVVSLGGGALGNPETVRMARENGLLVFIRTGFETCYRRIRDSGRPIVLRSTKKQLRELYRSRQPVYESACHIKVEGRGSPAQISGRILDALILSLGDAPRAY